MGRGQSKAPSAPAFKPGEIRYGNKVVGKTYLDPKTGAIVNQYYPDSVEEKRKKLVQQKINALASTLGQTAPELASLYNQTEGSFVEDAKNKFLEQYNPTLTALREDIGSRFGTLNNSQFFDKLNDLEKNKTSALADIINRGKQLKYDLVNKEEAKKLNQIQALGGLMNSDQVNFLNNLQAPLDTSGYLNSFLNSQWMSQLNDYRQNLMNQNTLQSNMARGQGLKGLIMSKFL